MKKTFLLALCLMSTPGFSFAQDGADRAKTNPLARFALEDFADTLRRPLFSATRRPPSPIAAPIRREPPPPPEPPHFTLVGVVTDERGARALVKISPTAKIRGLRRGDEIDGWTVVEVGPRRIVIGRDARTSAVALFDSKSRPAKTASTRPSSDD